MYQAQVADSQHRVRSGESLSAIASRYGVGVNQLAELNGLRNQVGYLAMARTANPNSASAQFFINVKDNAFLDPVAIPAGDPVPRFEYQGRVYENVERKQLEAAPQLFGYTVFGKVVSGMEVVTKITTVPTGTRMTRSSPPLASATA